MERPKNSLFTKLTHRVMYHGSDKKFDIIEPLGVNMGTKFSKPRLSSFFWMTKEEALGWMVYQVLRRQGGIKCYYYIPTGGFLITPDNVKVAERYLKKAKGYLYTATIRLDKIGVGSSPDISEFTVDYSVVPDEVQKVAITQSLLDRYMTVDKQDKIVSYISDIKNGKYSKRRGLVLSVLLDRERDSKRHDPKIREDLGLDNAISKASQESSMQPLILPPSAKW